MNDYLKYPLLLFAVVVICTFLVTVTYNVTTPILAARQQEVIKTTLNSMYDNIKTYEKVERTYASSEIKAVYQVELADSSSVYVYQTASIGKNGNIEMLISAKPDGQFDVIKYTKMQETTGIGTKVTEPSYLEHLTSQTANSVKVDTITGATISSSSVSRMMTAVGKDFTTNYQGGGQ